MSFRYGNVVRTTAGILIAELRDWELGRETDERTGHRELLIRGLPDHGGGGRPRSSFVGESRSWHARQRPAAVLPRRRFRAGASAGARARRPVRRGAPRQSEYRNP